MESCPVLCAPRIVIVQKLFVFHRQVPFSGEGYHRTSHHPPLAHPGRLSYLLADMKVQSGWGSMENAFGDGDGEKVALQKGHHGLIPESISGYSIARR